MSHSPLQFIPVNSAVKQSHVLMEGAFSEDEMIALDHLCEALTLAPALVGPQAGIDHNRRNAEVGWLGHSEETGWLFSKIMGLTHRANLFFGLDIWGIVEEFQYSIYTEDGRYCWHMDSGISPDEQPRPPRKISFTLQMTDPDRYAGGELELLAGERMDFKTPRGSIIFFPSYMTHRVDTLRAGLRRSLVGWIAGPDFR